MPTPLLIGTRGWAHAGWTPSFYPDELPPDWRFCFYSNRLRSVLVPAEMWVGADVATVAAWRNDSDPEFRFVLELPAALDRGDLSSLSSFLELIRPIAPQLAGFVLRAASLETAVLATLLAGLAPIAPLCVDAGGSLSDGSARLFAEYQVGRLWDAERGEPPPPGGRLCVGIARGGDPRRLRHLIEAMTGWRSGEATAALFFEHETEGARLAEQARTRAEFMGV